MRAFRSGLITVSARVPFQGSVANASASPIRRDESCAGSLWSIMFSRCEATSAGPYRSVAAVRLLADHTWKEV